MRKLLFIALAFFFMPFLSIGTGGNTNSTSTTQDTSYHSPTPGHIPIIAWDHTVDTTVLRPLDPIIPGGINFDQSKYKSFLVELKPSGYRIIEY